MTIDSHRTRTNRWPADYEVDNTPLQSNRMYTVTLFSSSSPTSGIRVLGFHHTMREAEAMVNALAENAVYEGFWRQNNSKEVGKLFTFINSEGQEAGWTFSIIW